MMSTISLIKESSLTEVTTKALYKKSFPLLQLLLADEEKISKKKNETVSRRLSVEQSWDAYSLACKIGYKLYALVSANKEVIAVMGLTFIP